MDYHDYVAEGWGIEDCSPEMDEPKDIRNICSGCANVDCECCRSCIGKNQNTELSYWAKKG